MERVIVEIGILAPSDNVLMFEAPGGIKKDHIYSFGIQFAGIPAESQGRSTLSSMPYVSSATSLDSFF